MAMQMLAAGGLSVVTDGLREHNEDNPRGYFEDERVKDLEKSADRSWLENARGKGIKVISYLLKELPSTNNYKVIFMERELTEVVKSQAKMLERRGEPNETADERMIELYEDHLFRVRWLLRHGSHFESLDISYQRVVAAPKEQAERIRAFVDRPLDLEAMVRAVDGELYRNRK